MRILSILLYTVMGFVLGQSGIFYYTWNFWAIMGILVAVDLMSMISALKNL